MNTKVLKHRVDVDVPDEKWQIVDNTDVEFRGALFDQLIELHGDEARRMPRVNEARLDQADRGEQLMRTTPQFVPPYVNPDVLRRNIDAAKRLRVVQRRLAEQHQRVTDTLLVLRVQADGDLRAYYSLLQKAAEMGQPAATAAYEELARAYARKRKAPDGSPVDGESAGDDEDDAIEASALEG